MSKEGSVAPKERINITYKPATGDGVAEEELPQRMLMIGDYTQRADSTPLELRKPIDVNKDNFNDVLGSMNPTVAINVKDKLSGEQGGEMGVSLSFKHLNDFTPEGIVNQVPELKRLLELRSALNALKSPLVSIPAFRKKLQSLLGDTEARQKLVGELGLADKPDAAK